MKTKEIARPVAPGSRHKGERPGLGLCIIVAIGLLVYGALAAGMQP